MTICGALSERSNNYLDTGRHAKRLQPIIDDPFDTINAETPGARHVSIVIPSHQSVSTVVPCVQAIAESTFNQRHPDLLEVVVVDDGSNDGTFEHFGVTQFGVNLTVVRQINAGRAGARNTGCAVARGDVLIFCDADMILTATAIDQILRVQEYLPNSVAIGFRADIRCRSDRAAPRLARSLPRFFYDNRYTFDQPGWPDNMMATSSHLQRLGCGRQFWLADNNSPQGRSWMLPRMVYGVFFAVPRSLLHAVGGFDERFQGWGWEDAWFGARAIYEGAWIVPVPGAAGYHIAHPDRSATRWQEARQNQALYTRLAEGSIANATIDWLGLAAKRIDHRRESTARRSLVRGDAGDAVMRSICEFLADPRRSAGYYEKLGRWERALDSIAYCSSAYPRDSLVRARCHSAIGNTAAALDELHSAHRLWPHSHDVAMELVWEFARVGHYDKARATLSELNPGDETNAMAAYLKRYSPDAHCSRGWLYLRQEMTDIAWRDFAAALLLDERHLGALEGLRRCRGVD